MSLRRYVLFTFLVVLSATSLYAQRTADFRRLSLENGNAAQKSWLISDQSSLGIDENGTLTGTFPNTNAMLTLGAGTKGNALDIQSLVGGTGILFSQNIPSVGIDMLLGASGTGIIIDGGTPVGITIGNATAGSDGMTVDATNSGISIGNGTAPNNGMNIEAISNGLAIGTSTTPDIGQTTEANLIGGTFDAGIIGVDIGQINSPTLGLGVRSNGTGIDVSDVAFVGTGINVTMNNFFGTGLNIQDNTFSGTGINVSAGINSTGINVSGTTNNVLVVNGTADATLLSVGADPVWDARINGDLHVSGETKFGGSIYVDGTTPDNHSILANDDLTIGTNAPGQNFNLVAGLGGIINITAPIMFPALPSLSNLDMGNFRILNIGNAGTDFTAAGGLTLADQLTVGNIPALSTSLNVLVTNAGVVEQRTAASIIAGTAWALPGNAGTTAGTNFVGTTDNVALHLNVRNGVTVNNSLIFGTDGSISRQITGVTVGNARGTQAVDLQLQRNVAIEVASGQGSFLGAGANNRASGTYAAVVAGQGNDATNSFSFVGGGENNQATGFWSVIGGGNTNTASNNETFVGSGTSVQATGFRAAVVGGIANVASGEHSFIGGGGQFGGSTSGNIASGATSTIGGGRGNRVTDDFGFIGGGDNNRAGDNAGTTADKPYATVGGGILNTATGNRSTIGGGDNNIASEADATVAGGGYNRANAVDATVGGGSYNTVGVAANWSVIPGGNGMTLNGQQSFGFLGSGVPSHNQMIIAAANTAAFGNANLWLANNNNAASELRFYEAQNTTGAFPAAGINYSAFKAGVQGANILYILPTALPVSKGALVSDLSGTLTWGSHRRVAATAGVTTVINDASVTATNTIICNVEGTVTFVAVTARNPGVSFTVTSGAALVGADFINYQILP